MEIIARKLGLHESFPNVGYIEPLFRVSEGHIIQLEEGEIDQKVEVHQYNEINSYFQKGTLFRIATVKDISDRSGKKFIADGQNAVRLVDSVVGFVFAELPDRNDRDIILPNDNFPGTKVIFLVNGNGDCYGPLEWDIKDKENKVITIKKNTTPLDNFKLPEEFIYKSNFKDIFSFSVFNQEKSVCLAPSCTLFFHPAIKKIAEILQNNELGKISNFLYHSGQYLPDWHTYEDVSEYYVSNKETGGGREIVPFELTWITLVLGFPKRVVGLYKNAIQIKGADDIDDTYNLLMDYGQSIFNLSVDVVSRYATRRLVINGDKKQLYWNWDDNMIKIYDPESNEWEEIKYETISAQSGYNKNITEQMYIDEMEAFLKAAKNESPFPNTLEHDHQVLKVLYAVESSDNNNVIEKL